MLLRESLQKVFSTLAWYANVIPGSFWAQVFNTDKDKLDELNRSVETINADKTLGIGATIEHINGDEATRVNLTGVTQENLLQLHTILTTSKSIVGLSV